MDIERAIEVAKSANPTGLFDLDTQEGRARYATAMGGAAGAKMLDAGRLHPEMPEIFCGMMALAEGLREPQAFVVGFLGGIVTPFRDLFRQDGIDFDAAVAALPATEIEISRLDVILDGMMSGGAASSAELH
jgi:hypothetical protein